MVLLGDARLQAFDELDGQQIGAVGVRRCGA